MTREEEKFVWQALFSLAGMVSAMASGDFNQQSVLHDLDTIGKYATERFMSIK